SQSAETQETPSSCSNWNPWGSAGCCNAHEVPSNRSASARIRPWLSTHVPTDVQPDEPTHDTARSSFTPSPCGLTWGWKVHFDPFHPKANTFSTTSPKTNDPTASQWPARTHVTASRPLPFSEWGFRVGMSDHFRPCHRSDSG